MIDSKGWVARGAGRLIPGSVVVSDQRPVDQCAGGVVVPDGGGEREEALQDTEGDSGGGAPAVAFEVELRFEGLVDRLDDLAQRFEQGAAGPFGLALAGRTQQPQPGLSQF